MHLWSSVPWTMNGKVREPTLLEYFATSALDSASQMLVREAIQNSLDAALKTQAGAQPEPVRVRFFISGNAEAAGTEAVNSWFRSLIPHVRGQKKFKSKVPADDERCAYVVYEDFGTRGLHGAYDRNYVEDHEDNAWVYFFHKEGDNQKQAGDRGRWGIGKVVFPGSSRIQAFVALTVREDGKRLLMGQAMLGSRQVGNVRFMPDAWLCANPGDPDRPPMPMEDNASIGEFCQTFSVSRKHETGLSIVIPYVHEADDEAEDKGISFESILDAVLADYFLPILRGELEVEVEGPGRSSVEANARTFRKLIDQRQLPLVCARRAEINLALWSASEARGFVALPKQGAARALKWDDSMFPPEIVSDLKEKFDSGEAIAVRVPVVVRRKSPAGTEDSHFDVLLQRQDSQGLRYPLFIREGLIIPDVRGTRVRDVVALVVAEHDAMASLLGDAENPAHTEWQSKSGNFKDKYVFGPSYIKFVMESAAAILKRLTTVEDEEDAGMLIDVFSLPPVVDEAVPRRRKRPPGSDGPSKLEVAPQGKPKRFRIDRTDDGFVVSRGDVAAEVPPKLVIRAAYDLRRGNPFSKWNEADFRMAEMIRTVRHADVLEVQDNRIVMKITGPDFEIPFGGFDLERDLKVDVRTGRVGDEAHD